MPVYLFDHFLYIEHYMQAFFNNLNSSVLTLFSIS